MSRRSARTVTISVKFTLPPGASQKDAVTYVRAAVGGWKGGMDPSTPIASISTNELLVKVIKSETIYL